MAERLSRPGTKPTLFHQLTSAARKAAELGLSPLFYATTVTFPDNFRVVIFQSRPVWGIKSPDDHRPRLDDVLGEAYIPSGASIRVVGEFEGREQLIAVEDIVGKNGFNDITRVLLGDSAKPSIFHVHSGEQAKIMGSKVRINRHADEY